MEVPGIGADGDIVGTRHPGSMIAMPEIRSARYDVNEGWSASRLMIFARRVNDWAAIGRCLARLSVHSGFTGMHRYILRIKHPIDMRLVGGIL